MPMSGKQMIKLLEKNGFKVIRIKGSHHFMVNEQTRKKTTVPLHKSLDKGTEQGILKQAGLK